MDVPAAEGDLARLHADHAPLGEHGLHLLHGKRVVFIAVLRQDDAAVDDEEVHIRRDGDLAVCARERALHGVDRRRALKQARPLRQAELVHLQPAPPGIRRLRERVVGVVRGLVKRVLRVVRPDARDLARTDEAGHVVDVAVGLVGVDAVAQPEDLFAAEIVAEHMLDRAAVHGGVAPLGQQAHLSREHRTLAVDMDRPALEHEALGAVGIDTLQLAHLLRDLIVEIPREIEPVDQTAPGVERPVHGAQTAAVVDEKRRTAVADPRVVARHLDDAHGARQALARGLVLRRADADRHGFKLQDGLRHVQKRPLRGLGAVAPVVVALRPEHPHAGLRLEFRRHPVAVALGRLAVDSFCLSIPS